MLHLRKHQCRLLVKAHKEILNLKVRKIPALILESNTGTIVFPCVLMVKKNDMHMHRWERERESETKTQFLIRNNMFITVYSHHVHVGASFVQRQGLANKVIHVQVIVLYLMNGVSLYGLLNLSMLCPHAWI